MTIIRDIRPEETPVLDDFLYEAIFIPEGVPAPHRSIIEDENLQIYVRDFGQRPDDRCLVADDYGHIDNQTPSLAISLYKEYRSRGIGSDLLRQMLERLRSDGYQYVSLSVQKANYALRMYEKAGFRTVADRGEEVLMLCKL